MTSASPVEVLVLPSPFLPPLAYEPLVAALGRAGRTAGLADAAAPGTGSDLVERWAGAAAAGRARVLIAHSNAGLCVPGVRARSGRDLTAVLVDAALPATEGATPMAPPAFRERLAALADEEGRLPPWTRWWPRPAFEPLVSDDAYDRLDAACPRLPLAYLHSEVVAPSGWASHPHAYLAFGSTYAAEIAFAAEHGWPTRVLDAGHLHLLTEPDAVVEAVLRLLERLPE